MATQGTVRCGQSQDNHPNPSGLCVYVSCTRERGMHAALCKQHKQQHTLLRTVSIVCTMQPPALTLVLASATGRSGLAYTMGLPLQQQSRAQQSSVSSVYTSQAVAQVTKVQHAHSGGGGTTSVQGTTALIPLLCSLFLPHEQCFACPCERLGVLLAHFLCCQHLSRQDVVVEGAAREGGVLRRFACVLAKPSDAVLQCLYSSKRHQQQAQQSGCHFVS